MGSTITLPLSTDLASWDWKAPIMSSLEIAKGRNEIRRFGLGRTRRPFSTSITLF
jgi:hypothetical protein